MMNRKKMILNLSILWLLYFLSVSCSVEKQPNVLFIAIDDLNDWIGVMDGHPQTKTPNIDALAQSGMLFTNAHCQAPICGPSRASVMSGLYPSTSGNYLQVRDKDIKRSNEQSARSIFLPDYLEQYGYKTMAVGKIYHRGDDAQTFDEYGGQFAKSGPKPPKRFKYDPEWYGKPRGTQTDWGAYPQFDSLMPDYQSAQWAVEKLNQTHDKPFLLAVGFVRPHVPWYVPPEWFAPFPVDDVQLPPYLPNDLDDIPEFGQRLNDVPMMPTTEWLIKTGQWKDVVQAYLACIHFVDAQVGKIIDALNQSAYAENTIVVLWSDHGYHLGEKNRFAKQALWERNTKSVLIIKDLNSAPGQSTNKPVQLLDMYPTILDLCHLPNNPQNEGHSLKPLLQNPAQDQWPHMAISSFGQGNVAISGERYRLIQYEDGSTEFYDLKNDPNEWTNLSKEEQYEDEISHYRTFIPAEQAELSKHNTFNLNDYWREVIKARK